MNKDIFSFIRNLRITYLYTFNPRLSTYPLCARQAEGDFLNVAGTCLLNAVGHTDGAGAVSSGVPEHRGRGREGSGSFLSASRELQGPEWSVQTGLDGVMLQGTACTSFQTDHMTHGPGGGNTFKFKFKLKPIIVSHKWVGDNTKIQRSCHIDAKFTALIEKSLYHHDYAVPDFSQQIWVH